MTNRIAPAGLLALLLLLANAAIADSFEDTMESFQDAGDSAIYFDSAHAWAVFPSIGQGGVGIGAARGRGRVFLADGTHHGNVTMTQLSVGLQLGGQVYSMIIFFEDERSLREFTQGNFEFGAQASAVAITAGASARASTAGGAGAGISGGRNDAAVLGDYSRGMAVFSIARGGLMYEAALGGMKFRFRPVRGG
ncbi:MAG: lipid-binding SYLF domain-containing protein [Pseudomonadota bacterium]